MTGDAVNHGCDLIPLAGARLVRVSEPEHGGPSPAAVRSEGRIRFAGARDVRVSVG